MVIGRHDSPPTAIVACTRFGNTRYQTDAALQGLVEVFASLKHACRNSSKSSPASSTLAGTRRSLRQLHAGLQGPVEVFASLKQACRDSSKSSPASSTLAWLRFTVNQRQARLHGPIYSISAPSRLAGPDIQYSNYPKTNRYHTNKHK